MMQSVRVLLRALPLGLSGLLTLSSGACITVNIHFPAAEIESAAERIIDDVRSAAGDVQGTQAKDTDEPGAEEGDEDEASLGRSLDAAAGGVFIRFAGAAPATAELEEIDEKDDEDEDPVIRSIKKSLKERFVELKVFFVKGALGEARDGMVAERETEELDLKEKKKLAGLVRAENKDRLNLYKRVAELQGVDPSRLDDIRKIFAKKWIEKAETGWWVQDEKGDWTRKKADDEKAATL